MKDEKSQSLITKEQNKNEKNEFKPLSFWRELFLKEDELIEYYNNKRKYEFENNVEIKGMKIRDVLHPILLKLVKLNRKLFTKQTITILNDLRQESNKPVIFAFTHIGMYDVQIFCEAIKDHHYIFAGDPETMYRSFDGLLFSLNGVVYCDTDSKDDRYIATETAKKILKSGKNLTIAPEGVWNLSPNLLSLPLYPGIIKIAMETGCDIIPVAVEQYGDDFFVNIGKNINVSTDRVFENDDELKIYVEQRKDELRDILSTLKWEIIEQGPKLYRKDIETYDEAYKKFVTTRLEEWKNPKNNQTYYTEEKVKQRTFKPKNVQFFQDVFSHLKNLKLCRENAFLFRSIDNLPTNIREHMLSQLSDENIEQEDKNLKVR